MVRICLIGPGDIDYHYFDLLKMPKEKFDKHFNSISKTLAKTESELILLPDKGIPIEVAKKYKEQKGKKVYAAVPLSDTDFGIKHLQEHIDAKINLPKVGEQKLFDEIINTDNWYKQDMTLCLYGDVILLLGKSLGSIGELTNAFYIYKIIRKMKDNVNTNLKENNILMKAGDKFPFTVLVYMPFCKGKLSLEIESYIKKTGGQVIYIRNTKELKENIENLNKMVN